MKILVRIVVNGLEDWFECYGDPELSFETPGLLFLGGAPMFVTRRLALKAVSARNLNKHIVRMLRENMMLLSR